MDTKGINLILLLFFDFPPATDLNYIDRWWIDPLRVGKCQVHAFDLW